MPASHKSKSAAEAITDAGTSVSASTISSTDVSPPPSPSSGSGSGSEGLLRLISDFRSSISPGKVRRRTSRVLKQPDGIAVLGGLRQVACELGGDLPAVLVEQLRPVEFRLQTVESLFQIVLVGGTVNRISFFRSVNRGSDHAAQLGKPLVEMV